MSEEMEERTVEGKLQYWTKEVKYVDIPNRPGEGYYECAFHIEGEDSKEWHNLFSSEKSSLDKLREEAPRGSVVKLVEHKRKEAVKWVFKTGTFVVLEKGSSFSGKQGFKRDFADKKEREINNLRMVAMNSLNRAVELVVSKSIPLKDLNDQADEFERRIMNVEHRLSKGDDDSIPEEEIKQ